MTDEKEYGSVVWNVTQNATGAGSFAQAGNNVGTSTVTMGDVGVSWDDVRAEIAAIDMSEGEMFDALGQVETLEDISNQGYEDDEVIGLAGTAMRALSKYGPDVVKTAAQAMAGNIPAALTGLADLADKIIAEFS